MRYPRALVVLLLIFSAANAFTVTQAFAEDFSGTYNVELLCAGQFVMTIEQSGSWAAFSIEGVCEGTGTVSGSTMHLEGAFSIGGGGTLTLDLHFSESGDGFQGTAVITSGDRPPESFLLVGSKDKLNGQYDVDTEGIPRFVNTDYIELAKIERISKFRSGEGHDYSDEFESCRSMKHYFCPREDVDWSAVKIYAPVDGTICSTNEEGLANSGRQIRIKSKEYPAFYFALFHVDPEPGVVPGSEVAAGQLLGTHTGDMTTSDIAVGVFTLGGERLVSYFDVMTDALFCQYRARGLDSRSDVIITKEERDADPLTCQGETFIGTGNIENWVELGPIRHKVLSPLLLLLDD